MRIIPILAGFVVGAFCFNLAPVLAQVMTPTPANATMSDVIPQIILMTASAVISAGVGIGSLYFARITGIRIESEYRQVLHGAAMTGVNLALAKYGPAVGLSVASQSRVVEEAMDWIKTVGAPQAMAGLKLGDAEIQKIVEAKLGAMVNASATVAVTTGSTPTGS